MVDYCELTDDQKQDIAKWLMLGIGDEPVAYKDCQKKIHWDFNEFYIKKMKEIETEK